MDPPEVLDIPPEDAEQRRGAQRQRSALAGVKLTCHRLRQRQDAPLIASERNPGKTQ